MIKSLVNTDFMYLVVLKIVQHIDDQFSTDQFSISYKFLSNLFFQNFFIFCLFLLQKMKNKDIDKKEIANKLKIFKELISLHSDKIKDLSSYKYHFQDIEEDIEDNDENDLDYLENVQFNLVQEYEIFHIEYEIDCVLKNQQLIKNE